MSDTVPGDPNDIIAPASKSYLVFDDPFKICKGNCLAATTTGFFDDSSKMLCGTKVMVEITDSDVFFNTNTDFWSSDELDGCTPFPPGSWEFSLEAVTTHEVGHLIGLGHSGLAEALMAPSIASCDAKELDIDDKMGRDALYACTLSLCAAIETDFCEDDIDNDCDGLIDGADPDCGGPADPVCGDVSCDTGAGEDPCSCALDCGAPPGTETLLCSDGIDNDCDNLTDCNDSNCDGDPACVGLPAGSPCTDDGDCLSSKCKGKPGSKTCK